MMKYFLFAFIFYSSPQILLSQVSINADGTAGDPSAGLDINFSDKGVLIPRLTTAQVYAINSPATGLMVFNTTLNRPVYFDGSIWNNFDGTPMFEIGQSYGGGIIFYLDVTGRHGLIAAPNDLNAGSGEWGCTGTLIGTTGTAIGTGQANTAAIVNACSDPGYAAYVCDTLTLNGYSDWFLPSIDELQEMYLQRNVIGGFHNNSGSAYWSSSEWNDNYSWYLDWYFGDANTEGKYINFFIRAVRAF